MKKESVFIDGIALATIQGEKRISVKELGNLIGMTPEQLSRIRNGAGTRELTVRRIAKALNVSVEAIALRGD